MVGLRRVRRALGAGVVLVSVIVGIQIVGTGQAFAHANAVTGSATCATDGTYAVTWTVVNDYASDENVTVTSADPGTSSVTPTSSLIQNMGTGQFVQRGVPGSARSAGLGVTGVWTVDGFTRVDSGTVTLDGTCLPSHRPATPTVTAGTCRDGAQVSGAITIPDDPGIVYTLDGTVRAAGTVPVTPGPHVVTATSTVYLLTGDTTVTLDVTAPPSYCGETVAPVAPTVVQAVCVPGYPNPSAPSLTTAVTDGVTYSTSRSAPYAPGQTVVVTATAGAGHRFGAAPPTGWTRVDDTHETFAVTFATLDCAPQVQPAPPTITEAVCAQSGVPTAPTLVLPVTTGIAYSASPAGDYVAGRRVTVTARAVAPNSFADPVPQGWTRVDPVTETYELTFADAPTCIAPQAPVVRQSVCGNDGEDTLPTVDLPSTAGVTYTVSDQPPYASGQRVVVTAAAGDGYQFLPAPADGWVKVDPTHETFAVTFDAAPTCARASSPTFVDDRCTGTTPAGASYTVPAVTGVEYRTAAGVVAPGTYPAADGSTVSITAVARPGFTLTGVTTFTHTFPGAPDCRVAVVPVSPSFLDGTCTAGNLVTGSYTIPSVAGVEYSVAGVVTPSGSYRVRGGVTVTITAVARDGFVLTGITTFSHAFPLTVTCPGAVRAVAPGFDPARCTGSVPVRAAYTIPAVAGVDYFVRFVAAIPSGQGSGLLTPPGRYVISTPGTVVVVARAQAGYTLVGPSSFTYRAPGTACGTSLIPASASFQDPVCVGGSGASYVIPTSVGATYYVSGRQVGAGAHEVPNGSTVTVIARPAAGFTLTGVTEWTHTFPRRATCSSTAPVTTPTPILGLGTGGTLGPTGAPAVTGTPVALLLAGGLISLLTGAGLLLLAGRRRTT